MWTYQIQICLLLSVHTYIGTSWSAMLQLDPTHLKKNMDHLERRTNWSAALQPVRAIAELVPTLLKEVGTTWSAGHPGAPRSSWSRQ